MNCPERNLHDVEGNVLFHIYKKKKKSGAKLGIVMGNDTTITVLDVNTTLNMMLFSVEEPKRTVQCDLTDEQLAYLNSSLNMWRRITFGKKITYSTTQHFYLAFVAQGTDVYVWPTEYGPFLIFV